MARASSIANQSARWRVVFNTLIVMAGTLVSRILGLLREVIFSDRFGTTPELGAFRASFSILDLLYLVIIGGALGSSLIPVFSRLIEEDQKERAWKLANTVLATAFVVFVVIAALVGIFARPLLAASVAAGYANEPAQLNEAVRLMRLMLVQPLLLGLAGLMMAFLQTFERFTLPTIGYNVYNLAIIIAAWLFGPQYGIDAVAWGVVVGALLFLLVLLPGVTQIGFRFQPSFDWRMPEFQRVGQLLGPRLLGQSALQINIIVMLSLIGLIGADAVSRASAQAANGYAVLLLMLPHGIIAVSLGTVMFPRLTRFFAANRMDDLRQTSWRTLRLVLWLTVPIAVLLMLLHVPVARLLFERGKFDAASLALTSRALLFYAPAAIGLAGAEIVIRTFYAMEDTRTPVTAGVATIVLNAFVAWAAITFISRDIGLIALSYSLTNVLEFMLLAVLLKRRLGRSHATIVLGATRRFITALAASTTALVLVVGAALVGARGFVPGVTSSSPYQAGNDFVALALWFGLTGLLGVGAYMAVGTAMGAPEVQQLWALVRRRKA
jgi:putative peptidoglycan lipid II flippase